MRSGAFRSLILQFEASTCSEIILVAFRMAPIAGILR